MVKMGSEFDGKQTFRNTGGNTGAFGCVVSLLRAFLLNASHFGSAYFRDLVRLPVVILIHLVRLLSISRATTRRQNRVLSSYSSPTLTQVVSCGWPTVIMFGVFAFLSLLNKLISRIESHGALLQ